MSSSKVWLITGANAGLGLTLAQCVLSKGDKVIAAARDAAKIPPSLSGAKAYTLDPSAPEDDVKRAAKEALKIYGRIDVLVNNAGYGHPGTLEELRSEDIRAQYQTNVFGPIALIQALLPAFRAQRSGHILNVSSVAGFAGLASFSAYNSSKAALDAFSEVLAEEVAPFGVHVHIIAPGYFPTNFLAKTKAAHEAANPERSTGAYMTREQGHGLVDSFHPARVASRQVGDPEKAAERMYEVVAGTGVAQGLMDHREWVRVPLGPDAGNRIRTKAAAITASVDAYEPIWKSTNMDDAQLNQRFGV
ncbi:NAD-P-binding protein [Lactifluus subvellereus]|nr:NAD-P-binding protein [Lactifluus subvellereus]